MVPKEQAVSASLKKKAADIVKSVESITEKTRDWQLIKQFMLNRLGDIKLTPKQVEKMGRYQFAYNQMAGGKYNDNDVINLTMNMYGLEYSQACEDVSASKEIFSTVININKKFELNIQLQVNRNLQKKAEQLCDFKALAAFEKNRIAMLAMVQDEEENPADQFVGHQFEAVFNPSLIGAVPVDLKELMTVINEKRKVKLKPELFQHLEFIDIPHEKTNSL
jgi:hypothetical protein